MSVLWGLFSCCGIGVALVALVVGFFVARDRVQEKLNWRRWRRQAPRLLEDPAPPVPPELGPGREQRAWRGGYLDGGGPYVRETGLRLLRTGIVCQARVVEARHRGDADDWYGYIVYAFRRPDGTVEVARTISSVNTWGAAVSQGSGTMEPAFDCMDTATDVGWLHVLLDPLSSGHIIYEALRVTTRVGAAPAQSVAPRPPPVARASPSPDTRPQRVMFFPTAPPTAREPGAATNVATLPAADEASFPPAPQNIHSFPRTPQFTTLVQPPPPPTTFVFPKPTPAGSTEEQRLLRDALAHFPTARTDDDDEARRVVADMLVERGFVRGELIALQTVAQPTAAHRARIAELLRLHAEAWLPPGVNPRRFEFRRGFAWSVSLEAATDFQHLEWAFIRHLEVRAPGGPGLFDGLEHLTLSSLTGVGQLALWYLLRGHFPRGVQHLELAMAPGDFPPQAELLRQLPPLPLIGVRSRRQEVPNSLLASMLDALPTPPRVRLVLLWGNVRGFQREVARRAWLRTLELVSLESTAGSLTVEITATSVRVVTTGRPEATAWSGLSAALRAQGFASIPVVASETGAQRVEPLG